MGENLALQKQETAKARAAYAEYEMLGPHRSLANLAQRDGKKTSYIRQLQRWSSEYGWVERANRYDMSQVEERRRRREAEREKMEAEHALIGHAAAIRAADLLRQRMESSDIGTYALVQLLKIGTDLERLARGAATERQEITGKAGGPIVIETQWGTSKVANQEDEE